MAKPQIHKRLSTRQVKLLFDWYETGKLSLDNALSRLGCKESRFYDLLRGYRKDKDNFTISYPKRKAHNRIPQSVECQIKQELKEEKKLIANRDISITQYNYTAVRDEIVRKTNQSLSAETIRNRAKEWNFIVAKPPKKAHDREVVTTAAGMLYQHDSSDHLWSPFAPSKWKLITTLEDFSRYMMYADFFKHETAFAHIQAAESVILNYGMGLAYYTDSLRTFRYVCHKDSVWQNQKVGTDEILTQWKRVIKKCGMQAWPALSAQAKGKIERPYRWLQDRIVRRCAKEGIKDIDDARIILREEVKRYNEKQVHSTTREIPTLRLQKAINTGNHVFKPFQLKSPYTSSKDIFCLHDKRVVDGYRYISWKKYKIKVPRSVPIGSKLELHIIPEGQSPEIRLWYKNKVIKVARIK